MAGARHIDAAGCLATPGLVNAHHHLYQWITRGLAQQANLFGWLTELYPVWARLDDDLELAAARAALATLLVSGCTTATEAAIDRWHDPGPGAMLRIAVAPCSPFSATGELMTEAAALARRRGVRLHTHLAETVEEERFCRQRFGCTPAEYLDGLAWLGDDVWLAHCVHLEARAVRRFGRTGTAVAHCPSSNARLGSGIAPVADLLEAGAPVGLGVDGAASNEAGQLGPELRQALLAARLRGGAAALTARQALELGTIGGARCLGREDELGSLEQGKLADVALWRVDGLGHADVADPVAALVLGPPAPVELLLVGGRVVVERGELRTGSEQEIARQARAASRRLLSLAGVTA